MPTNAETQWISHYLNKIKIVINSHDQRACFYQRQFGAIEIHKVKGPNVPPQTTNHERHHYGRIRCYTCASSIFLSKKISDSGRMKEQVN